MGDAGDIWGRLIPLFGEDRSPVEMKSDLFSIGRKRNCDLCLSTVPVVSGCHCSVIRDPEGKVWLQDTSTNGTIINTDRKLLDDVCEIEHKTQFHLVFRRNAPAECIGYRFEKVIELQNPTVDSSEAAEQENLPENRTQEIDNEVDASEENEEESGTQEFAQNQNDVEEAEAGDKNDRKRTLESSEAAEAAEAGSSAPKRVRPSSPRPGPSREVPETSSDSGLLETLICAICQEILYDCVSVQPCLHSFCAGCFSDWMQGSCPQCRKACTRVSRNHLVNNVVEEYLKKHPDQIRSQEDRDDLDRRNKIKDAIVNLASSTGSDYSSPDYSGPDYSGPGSPTSPSLSPTSPSNFGLPMAMRNISDRCFMRSFTVRLWTGFTDTDIPVCRQCPHADGWSFRNGLSPRSVQPPAFTCNHVGTNHVLCQCCLEAMPQRSEPEIAARQRCTVCRAHYCRQYFGCSATCTDCLMPLKDSSLTGPVQFDLINRNNFESRVLLNYLRDKCITLRQLMIFCAENFVSHQYFTPSYPAVALTPESLVCRSCSHRLLRDFAYHYRAAIDSNDLPAEVRIRPNCRWGKNCRTQIRPHHAERYNHICEQTQFESVLLHPNP